MQASVPQNDSRHPLTRLLGNGGNIRVLRALAADDLPLSVTQLAERCGLTPQGTRLALEPVTEVGDGIRVAAVMDPFGNRLGLIQNPHFDPRAVR